jgi:hypothetical protein
VQPAAAGLDSEALTSNSTAMRAGSRGMDGGPLGPADRRGDRIEFFAAVECAFARAKEATPADCP